MTLQKLQDKDKQAQKFRANQQLSQQGWKNIDGVLHHQDFLCVSKIFRTKFINSYHNNPLADYFGIKKTQKLVNQKYYWLILCNNIKNYVKRYNVCLTSKAVWHKPYNDFQLLPVLIYCWNNWLIDFITELSILIDWKNDSYDSIFLIKNASLQISQN